MKNGALRGRLSETAQVQGLDDFSQSFPGLCFKRGGYISHGNLLLFKFASLLKESSVF